VVGAGVVICLERGADLHMVQLMPLPLTVSCFSKIQIGFTFLVAAHPGSPAQRAVKLITVFLELIRYIKRELLRIIGGVVQIPVLLPNNVKALRGIDVIFLHFQL